MNFSWKFLLPLAMVNILVAAFWHYAAAWQFTGAPVVRWVASMALIAAVFAGLGQGIVRHKKWGPRVYRYSS